jgi:hypothetical protein
MTDRAYFQDLYDNALDFTMRAFYAAAVRERNNGHLGDCQHSETQSHNESSYGSMYYWTQCLDCGKQFNHSVSEPW